MPTKVYQAVRVVLVHQGPHWEFFATCQRRHLAVAIQSSAALPHYVVAALFSKFLHVAAVYVALTIPKHALRIVEVYHSSGLFDGQKQKGSRDNGPCHRKFVCSQRTPFQLKPVEGANKSKPWSWRLYRLWNCAERLSAVENCFHLLWKKPDCLHFFR